MLETFLVPAGTVATAKGEGPVVELSGAVHRVFLLILDITSIVEQESLDVSVYASADGTTWSAKPVLVFPQKFYRGQHPLLLNLTGQAETRFLRARWDVHRWGRGSETPMFGFSLSLKEVPPEILQEATAEAQQRA
jgi:hypothetical protein